VVIVTDGPQLLRLGGGQVLLRGPALLAVSRLAAAGVKRWYGVDGSTISPGMRQILEQLAAEASEHVRGDVRSDVPGVPSVASSEVMEPQPLSSAEAADLLGCSERHVRRIATSLGGRRDGASWTFDAAAVMAYQLEKKGTA
jgi:hypothetical protein